MTMGELDMTKAESHENGKPGNYKQPASATDGQELFFEKLPEGTGLPNYKDRRIYKIRTQLVTDARQLDPNYVESQI